MARMQYYWQDKIISSGVQSISSGIYPRALIPGSIPEQQLWDLSQSNSSGIYPRALDSGSIPEQQFWDPSKSISSGIYPRATVLGSIPEHHFLGIDLGVSKICPWDLIPETSFSFSGIRSQNPIFNRWDRSQSAKKSDYFHMLIQSKNHASNKGKMAGNRVNRHCTVSSVAIKLDFG